MYCKGLQDDKTVFLAKLKEEFAMCDKSCLQQDVKNRGGGNKKGSECLYVDS